MGEFRLLLMSLAREAAATMSLAVPLAFSSPATSGAARLRLRAALARPHAPCLLWPVATLDRRSTACIPALQAHSHTRAATHPRIRATQGLDPRLKVCVRCKPLSRYGPGGNVSCQVCPKSTLLNAGGTACLTGCSA